MENRPRQYRPESEKPKSTDPPKPESTLNRAVERTRDLYERNGWVFLPLGEAGKPSLSRPNLRPEQLPQLASPANMPPSSLEFQSWQVPQNQDKLSDRGIDKLSRDLAHRSEDETMPRIISANTARSSQPPEKQATTPEEVTAQARERQEIEESLSNLRQLATMRQRISAAQDLTQEQLDRLREHDQNFIEPIITGLNKRPYRIMKAGTLLYRMTKGDMSPARKPNYDLLHTKVAQWHKYYPAEYEDYLKKTSPMDRNRMAPAEIDLFISTVGIGEEGKSELAGVQNALVCAHDLIRAYQEVEVEPPKPLRQLYRRLEKRRDYLAPKPAKGSDL